MGELDIVRHERAITVHVGVQAWLECCIFGMVGKIQLTKLMVFMLNL